MNAPNSGVFLKRPLAVNAWRFTNDGDSYNLLHWINSVQHAAERPFARWINSSLIIPTLEGDMAANVGDWIIRGTKGEFYPCKPEIFADIYERIGDLALASAGEAGTATTPKSGVVHEHAVGATSAETPNLSSPSQGEGE